MSSAALRVPDWKDATDAAVAGIANDNPSPRRERALLTGWRQTIDDACAARRDRNLDHGEALLEAALTTADRDLHAATAPADRHAARERKASTSIALAAVRLERLDLAGAERLYREAIHSVAEDPAGERWRFVREGASALRRVASQLGRADAAKMALGLLHEAGSALGEADAQNELGLTHVALGELTVSPDSFEDARHAYEQALAGAASRPSAQASAFRWRVQINQAVALWQLGRLSTDTVRREQLLGAAATLLRDTIRELPEAAGPARAREWPRAMDNLGLVLLDQGNTDEAIKSLEAARDAWRDDDEKARTLGNLGKAYALAGRFADAQSAYDHALPLQPDTTRPLARSYLQHGRGLALRQYAESIIGTAPARALMLFGHAGASLADARAKRRHDWAPTLWAATTAALADVHFQIGQIFTNIVPIMMADFLYAQSTASLDAVDLQDINERRRSIVQFINAHKLYYGMADRTTLISDIERVFAQHGVPRSEWKQTWAEIAAAWESLPQPSPPSAAAGAAAPKLNLPDRAPKLYANRPTGQNIIDFLRDPEGWGPYVKAGVLTRPDLGRFDPQAYKAVENWLLSKPLPTDVHLPKKKEVVDAELTAVSADQERLRAAQRLLRARQRRAQSTYQG